MGRRKKQLEPFDSERFFNENRELCLKYMSKETTNLDVNDIDLPQEMTYDKLTLAIIALACANLLARIAIFLPA